MTGHAPRPRVRRVVRLFVVVAITITAAAGCAGRKGRNDDDPGPHDYAPRSAIEPTGV